MEECKISSHKINYYLSAVHDHCGIDDDESVVLTGGWEKNNLKSKKVTKYNANGEATSLPSLIVGRIYHACGKFINANQEMVSIMMDYFYLKFPSHSVLYCNGRDGH